MKIVFQCMVILIWLVRNENRYLKNNLVKEQTLGMQRQKDGSRKI